MKNETLSDKMIKNIVPDALYIEDVRQAVQEILEEIKELMEIKGSSYIDGNYIIERVIKQKMGEKLC